MHAKKIYYAFRETIKQQRRHEMSEYQLQIKQVVDYPRYCIYRQFVRSLITDQSIRTGGGSGFLFYGALQLCEFPYILPPY